MMRSRRSGFTLLELLITLGLLSIVLSVFTGVLMGTQRTYAHQSQALRDQDNLRAADALLFSALRNAGADPRRTSQALIDPDPLATDNWDNLRVKSDFNPANGLFTDGLEDVRIKVAHDTLFVQLTAEGAFEPYAHPIRSLRFYWYDRQDVQITSEANVANAHRVRYVLTAPTNPVTGETPQRESWVFLRNRR